MRRLWAVLFLVVCVIGVSPTPSAAAATPTLEAAITAAAFAPYRDSLARRVAALPGLTSTISATGFDALRAKPANALMLSQLAVIDAYGVSTLNTLVRTSANRPFVRWLLGSTDAMQQLLSGGEPRDGQTLAALSILQRITTGDSAARSGVLRKLAIAVALDHATPVDTGWYRIHADGTPDTIDPLSRYRNFKAARAAGKLDAGFDRLSVWHLRFVVDAWVRDVDLDWLRTTYAGPHSVVSERGETRTFTTEYTRSVIGNAGYELEYIDTNVHGTSVQSGALAFYGADADIERVLVVGGVCGAIAKYGVAVAQAYGIPAFAVGQPGHAAAVINTAVGSWDMHNDIYGIGASFLHGGTTIPLMSDTEGLYNDPDYGMGTRNFAPAYVLLYEQLSGPRRSTYDRSEWLRRLASGLSDRAVKTRLLTLAVTVEPRNVLAWRDRIAMAQSVKTSQSQWRALQAEIEAAFAQHPRILAELSARIVSMVVPAGATDAQKAAYVNQLYRRYDAIDATTAPQQAAIRDVILSALPSWMRQYIGAPTVSVTFSGASAGRISGYKPGMAFSLDNGTTWQSPSSAGFTFTPAQIATLTSNPVLYVRNRYSTSTDVRYAARLAVTAHPLPAPALSADDSADTLTGLTTQMEYSTNNGKTWTAVTAATALDLTGDVTIVVRYRGDGTKLPSLASRLHYTQPIDTALGAAAQATTAYAGFPASHVTDGNSGSYWLSSASVTPLGTPIRLVIDRGGATALAGVRLHWADTGHDWEGYAKRYTIDIADTATEPTADAADWQTVATVTDGNGGSDVLAFAATTARYVRLTVTESAGRGSTTWRWLSLDTFTIPGTTVAPFVAADPTLRYLSDTQWSGESAYAVENGSDTTCDKYHDGRRLRLAGTRYEKGIGLCYNMTLQYTLTGSETAFHAVIGVDDSVADSDTCTVQFEVIADSTTIYKSPVMTAASAPETIDLPLTNVRTLTIKYYSLDGSYPPSANWADAYVQ